MTPKERANQGVDDSHSRSAEVRARHEFAGLEWCRPEENDMKYKTAYIIEGHVMLVDGEDTPRRAAERIVEMIKFAITPSRDSIYIQQDAHDAFRSGNWDAELKRGVGDWRKNLPKEVTTVYETALRYGPLKLLEEPRICTHRRTGDGFATERIHMLSWFLKEYGKGLGHGEEQPIAQIQAADHMHLCIHEDHLPEMALYAQERAENPKAKAEDREADGKLARLLEDAIAARQSDAEREASARIMSGLRDMFCQDSGPRIAA